MDQNEEIFGRYMNDRAFQKAVADLLASEVYERLTGAELSVLKYR
jgi:type I restriction enzyme R subunit